MARIQFLNLPELVRDQIYTELLVPSVAKLDNGNATQELPYVNILHTNRKIYTEASDVFYSQKLPVIVSANGPTFLREGTIKDTPKLSETKDESKIAACKRFAMTIELLCIILRLCSHW